MMIEKLEISSSIGNSTILAGENLGNVTKYMPDQKTAIITDVHVHELYADSFPPADVVIQLQPGESHKTMDSLSHIFDELIAHEFDRSSFILAIGGGIVCDVAGFAASIFMRGVEFGFVSSTLLSQVDASVGGKNGVNFRGYKNMIGNFNLPSFVICDPLMLKTLPDDEILCGMGEVIKHGLIASLPLFEYIEQHTDKIHTDYPEVFTRFVYDSVVIKSQVVNADAREKGERRKLNFGHTFGHAFEKTLKIPHGMAVGLGMVIAAKISVLRGFISEHEVDRIVQLLQKIGMRTDISLSPEELFSALKHDKKREGENVHFVLLTGIGSSIVEKISLTELENIIYDLY
ncbi:MAG: 3-dehydroquinate synthase [Bacteroidales bacterium]